MLHGMTSLLLATPTNFNLHHILFHDIDRASGNDTFHVECENFFFSFFFQLCYELLSVVISRKVSELLSVVISCKVSIILQTDFIRPTESDMLYEGHCNLLQGISIAGCCMQIGTHQ